MEIIHGEFIFSSNFECGNLSRVDIVDNPGSSQVKTLPGQKVIGKHSSSLTTGITQNLHIDHEFKLWTKPDCCGTEFENNNRTWFCFSIKGGQPGNMVQLSVMNLNKQFKLYSQGMQPVVQCIGDCLLGSKWERIKDKCTFWSEDHSTVVSWMHTVPEEPRATYYAFTYPYSYTELQSYLAKLDTNYANSPSIYYCRELLIESLDKARLDLLTISSHEGMINEREDLIPDLFPNPAVPRPFRFEGKKIVFISARVHPGETPSSYVLKGLINFLLSSDPLAKKVRDKFVFKIIPMLNPDGVMRGHYRTDQRGVNLNRVYTNPSPQFHPTIFATKKLILYHHYGMNLDALVDAERTKIGRKTRTGTSDFVPETTLYTNPSLLLDEDACHSFSDAVATKFEASSVFQEQSLLEADEQSASGWDCSSNFSMESANRMNNSRAEDDFSNNSFGETGMTNMFGSLLPLQRTEQVTGSPPGAVNFSGKAEDIFSSLKPAEKDRPDQSSSVFGKNPFGSRLSIKPKTSVSSKVAEHDELSNLFMYIDLHGHASKRGIFIYGNWFGDTDLMVETMLFPKTLSLNCQNFDYGACNFSERNMYHKDRRDGMSKEGSGRVAVMRATGLLRSYTLECNYNTGRLVNPVQSCHPLRSSTTFLGVPPKYSPAVFEDCGHKLGMSLYDMIESSDDSSPENCLSQSLNLNSLRLQIQNSLSSSPRLDILGGQSGPTAVALHSKNLLLSSSTEEKKKYLSHGGFGKASTSRIAAVSPPIIPKHSPIVKGFPAKLPRLNRKNPRSHSVDAENQAPPLPSSSVASKPPKNLTKGKKKEGGRVKTRLKTKIGPKKLLYAKEDGEMSSTRTTRFTSQDQQQNIAKLTSSKHSLTNSVCLTPNISFKMSIPEGSDSDLHNQEPVKLVKKLGRKQRNKTNLVSKKLKIAEEEDENDDEKNHQTILSPRSPLASVCEPQASQSSSSGPCVIISQAGNVATFAKSSKQNFHHFSTAKRPTSKPTLNSVSKSIDRLPLVSSTSSSSTTNRMKLFPVKKTKKKVCVAPTSEPLQWVLREPLQVTDELEAPKPKTKRRKKNSRKSL